MGDLRRFVPTRLQQMQSTFYAQGGITSELTAYRKTLKIDDGVIKANAGLLAVYLCKFFGDNAGDERFEFDPDGVPSAVIEALLYDLAKEEYVADLVAWPLHAPDCFATALGPAAGADVLGVVHMVQRGGLPLRVFTTPHDWLAAGCQGCVPLSEKGGRYWLHKARGPFVVGNVEEGRWLRDLLGPFAGQHKILIPFDSERSAA